MPANIVINYYLLQIRPERRRRNAAHFFFHNHQEFLAPPQRAVIKDHLYATRKQSLIGLFIIGKLIGINGGIFCSNHHSAPGVQPFLITEILHQISRQFEIILFQPGRLPKIR